MRGLLLGRVGCLVGGFLGGGILGGWLGALGAHRLAKTRGTLHVVFALAIIAVAVFMLVKNLRG